MKPLVPSSWESPSVVLAAFSVLFVFYLVFKVLHPYEILYSSDGTGGIQLSQYFYPFAFAHLAFYLLATRKQVKARLQAGSFGEYSCLVGGAMLLVGWMYLAFRADRFASVETSSNDVVGWFYSLVYMGFWLVLWGLLLGRRTESSIRNNQIVSKICGGISLVVIALCYFQPDDRLLVARINTAFAPLMLAGYMLFYLATFNRLDRFKLDRRLLLAAYILLMVCPLVSGYFFLTVLTMGESPILSLLVGHFTPFLMWGFLVVLGVNCFGEFMRKVYYSRNEKGDRLLVF